MSRKPSSSPPYCICQKLCIEKSATKANGKKLKIWGCGKVDTPCKFYEIIGPEPEEPNEEEGGGEEEENKLPTKRKGSIESKKKKIKVEEPEHQPQQRGPPPPLEVTDMHAFMTLSGDNGHSFTCMTKKADFNSPSSSSFEDVNQFLLNSCEPMSITDNDTIDSSGPILVDTKAEDIVYCDCPTDPRTIASFKQSTTAKSSGKWFYGCPNWNTPNDCKFFVWKDDLDKKKNDKFAPLSKENVFHINILNTRPFKDLSSCPTLSPYTLESQLQTTKLYKILRNVQKDYMTKKDLCFHLFRDICIRNNFFVRDTSIYMKMYGQCDLRISQDEFFINELSLHIIPLSQYEKPQPAHPDDFVIPVQIKGLCPDEAGWIETSIATHIAFETSKCFIIVQRGLLQRYISEKVTEKVSDLNSALDRCYEAPHKGAHEHLAFLSVNKMKGWMPQGICKPIVTDWIDIPSDLASIYHEKLNPPPPPPVVTTPPNTMAGIPKNFDTLHLAPNDQVLISSKK